MFKKNKNEVLNYHFHLFSEFFFLLCFQFSICLFDFKTINEGKYPNAILLSSGNYFILMHNGIYIYDCNFLYNRTIYLFKENEIISSDYEKINIIFLVLLKENIYIYLNLLVFNFITILL